MTPSGSGYCHFSLVCRKSFRLILGLGQRDPSQSAFWPECGRTRPARPRPPRTCRFRPFLPMRASKLNVKVTCSVPETVREPQRRGTGGPARWRSASGAATRKTVTLKACYLIILLSSAALVNAQTGPQNLSLDRRNRASPPPDGLQATRNSRWNSAAQVVRPARGVPPSRAQCRRAQIASAT